MCESVDVRTDGDGNDLIFVVVRPNGHEQRTDKASCKVLHNKAGGLEFYDNNDEFVESYAAGTWVGVKTVETAEA